MRILLTMVLTVLLSAGHIMAANAKDDGGFGSSRFSAQAPSALGGAPVGTANVIAVVPQATPADIEPASGEEDVTPEEEVLDNGKVMQSSDHQSETITIKKDLSVR